MPSIESPTSRRPDNILPPTVQQRPLFLYGTLRALPLLAWALTGDFKKTETVEPLVQPAQIKGYARFSLHGMDYPAVTKHNDNSVVTAVKVQMLDAHGEEGELIDADVYLWNGDPDAVTDDKWDLDVFIRERLDDWMDLFGGMELVGDESEL
ncbi:hypothetical protein BJ138DRAFT_1118758 [Hygrophoropsis aurantiaca]|uniref:Uncharacterized protein n=1 Tax=Hygrophoropsis aurantiaca TaxID=72124 RepID=A0ACB7ZVM3_9AGAM|nr:hypothetical protein BJ138DRAFT_1118758 [Hygrophoropsis aurantiaca]